MHKKQKLPFEITYEKLQDKDAYEIIPDELLDIFPDYAKLAMHGKAKDIGVFLKLIEQYPNIPSCKNLLRVLYNKLGQYQKAQELNNWIVSEHPEFVFARVIKANNLMQNDEFDMVPELLGKTLDIRALYPHRKVFHIKEMLAYLHSCLTYCERTGDIDKAIEMANFLEEIIENDEEENLATQMLLEDFWDRVNFTEGEDEDEFDDLDDFFNDLKQASNSRDLSKLSELKHPELQSLFLFEADIPLEILHKIIALPTESLLDDIHLIINSFFEQKPGPKEKAFEFIHIFNILGEIKNPQVVDLQLSLLYRDADSFYEYLGDYTAELGWISLLKHANPNDKRYFDFVTASFGNVYAQNLMSEVFEQLAFHSPEMKDDVISWFIRVLESYLEQDQDDEFVDPELVAFYVGAVSNLKAKEAIPIIEMLFERDCVAPGVSGNLNSILNIINDEDEDPFLRPLLSLEQVYEDLQTWDSEEDEPFDIPMFTPQQPIQVIKIGRNDPCPCGSGAKFKKCCADKGIWN